MGEARQGDDDGLVLARAASGDAASFGVLFDRHAQTVYRFCWRRLAADSAPDADAEDLMSVVFLEAWASRERIVLVDGSVRPWLLGVATNVLRNRRRTVRRHRAALARATGHDEAADFVDGIASRVDATSAIGAFVAILQQLSNKDREIVELCLLEEVPTAVAAELLGLPEGTVKSRLARARVRMRRLVRSGEDMDPLGWSGHEQGEHGPRAAVGSRGAAWIR